MCPPLGKTSLLIPLSIDFCLLIPLILWLPMPFKNISILPCEIYMLIANITYHGRNQCNNVFRYDMQLWSKTRWLSSPVEKHLDNAVNDQLTIKEGFSIRKVSAGVSIVMLILLYKMATFHKLVAFNKIGEAFFTCLQTDSFTKVWFMEVVFA